MYSRAYLDQKLYGFMIPKDKTVYYISVENALEDTNFKTLLETKEIVHGIQRK